MIYCFSFLSISAASEVTVTALLCSVCVVLLPERLLLPDRAIDEKRMCRPVNLLSVWASVGDLVQNESFAELPSSIFFFFLAFVECVCVCACTSVIELQKNL